MEVSFYATFRPIVGGKRAHVELAEGATVRDLLDALVAKWPEFEPYVFDETGAISRRIGVYVEGRSHRWLPDGARTRLPPDARVDIFPPVAGG